MARIYYKGEEYGNDDLIIDSSPTEDSENLISSGGVYSALEGINSSIANKQDSLTFDNTPTANSNNPVTSGGIATALSGKQDTLTIDTSPVEDSENPITSGAVYTEINNLNTILGDINEALEGML